MRKPEEITPLTPEQILFFAQFYKKYNRFLYYVALEYAKDLSDAEDVVQDSYVRLLKNMDRLMESSHSGILGYISTTVESANADHQRKKHYQYQHITWDDNIFDIERTKWDFVSDLYLRSLIEALQAELPEREWTALVEKYYYGCSDEEIGKRMGVKSNSVRMIRSRILKKAKDILLGGSLIGGGGNER